MVGSAFRMRIASCKEPANIVTTWPILLNFVFHSIFTPFAMIVKERVLTSPSIQRTHTACSYLARTDRQRQRFGYSSYTHKDIAQKTRRSQRRFHNFNSTRTRLQTDGTSLNQFTPTMPQSFTRLTFVNTTSEKIFQDQSLKSGFTAYPSVARLQMLF